MIELKSLLALSQPVNGEKDWLANAEAGVDYLVSHAAEDETIIFASVASTFLHAVLAPRENVSPADHSDLLNSMVMQDASWRITYATGGGKPDRVYLESPLDQSHCRSLQGGESLVVRRHFDSVDKGRTRTEVSQKLTHALNLYWLDEESAFCRLDENGDVEPIVRIINLDRHTSRASDIVVVIRARELARYMVVTNTVLVIKFDFTRVESGSFTQWEKRSEYKGRGADLFYTMVSQPGASYANGIFLVRPKLTVGELVNEFRSSWDENAKQYVSFKAHDWKNRRLAEISCAPSALASYFERDSPLPFQITPAFFRPEVLQRYKADPEKYKLEHRSISSRAGWHLETYDVNEAGQVHTYLRYLGYLPYQEQLYWLSFNEWPKGTISKRAMQTDIHGEWTDVPDPLMDLVGQVRNLDDEQPDWWLLRGDDLRATIHYPITASPDEWADSLMSLDQLLVEGFAVKSIRKKLEALGRPYEGNWASLKLIQELLVAQGSTATDAANAVEALRHVHHLRSKVKGHAAQGERQQLIKEARIKYGTLKDHFRQLAFDCQEAFGQACKALRLSNSSKQLS